MKEREQLALDLFIESVIKVDEDLRSQARDQECLDELMHIRGDVLEYLYNIRRNSDGTVNDSN
jgi:hypothetical protein